MIDRWIQRFQHEALPEIIKVFQPARVLIFGSRVKGTAREDSDIDIIVISSCFAGMPFLKRMPAMLKRISFPKHVDYICYTPEEYEKIKNESSLLIDVLENSIEVAV
jgi:predicted nucleotidyltransferase